MAAKAPDRDQVLREIGEGVRQARALLASFEGDQLEVEAAGMRRILRALAETQRQVQADGEQQRAALELLRDRDRSLSVAEYRQRSEEDGGAVLRDEAAGRQRSELEAEVLSERCSRWWNLAALRQAEHELQQAHLELDHLGLVGQRDGGGAPAGPDARPSLRERILRLASFGREVAVAVLRSSPEQVFDILDEACVAGPWTPSPGAHLLQRMSLSGRVAGMVEVHRAWGREQRHAEEGRAVLRVTTHGNAPRVVTRPAPDLDVAPYPDGVLRGELERADHDLEQDGWVLVHDASRRSP